MTKIIAPNKQYNGVSAGVAFAAGIGHTDDPERIAWFTRNGYTIGAEELPAETVDRAEYDRVVAENAELVSALCEATSEIERLQQNAAKQPERPLEPSPELTPAQPAEPESEKPAKPAKAR